jgi:hypothetical protein
MQHRLLLLDYHAHRLPGLSVCVYQLLWCTLAVGKAGRGVR